MSEGFFRRWSRRKAASAQAPAGAQARALRDGAGNGDRQPADVPGDARMPTLDDVAALAADGDYAPFIARGADPAVRRAALRKLFADPHFATTDGLDIYMGDYTLASPMTPAMLAALAHARSTLDPAPLWRTDEPLSASDSETGSASATSRLDGTNEGADTRADAGGAEAASETAAHAGPDPAATATPAHQDPEPAPREAPTTAPEPP